MNKIMSSTKGKVSDKSHPNVTGEQLTKENTQAISQISIHDDSPDANQITELSEDIVVVSPGSMLSEARESLSYSQEHIASKLNFTLTLVKDIESDSFDPTIPVTFIRGYLINYAKLVNVDVEDVLASYCTLGTATMQRSEMLSFSKQTSKEAEHSRVMWLSYLIVAVLIGLTILWWQQENSHKSQDDDISLVAPQVNADSVLVTQNTIEEKTETGQGNTLSTDEGEVQSTTESYVNNTIVDNGKINNTDIDIISGTNISTNANQTAADVIQPDEAVLSSAVFTFQGDCWVNIFDATGERIAWGVKKSGYVMTIEGVPPLKVTVGKPELTSIVFNGEAVDMSTFNLGNIAKFNLPIGEYSAD